MQYKIYTDGSYNYKTNECSFGYIVIDKFDKIKYQYRHTQKESTGLRNVYAELKAIMYAVKFARQKKIKAEIYTDFEGALKVLNSSNMKFNRKYKCFVNSYKDLMFKSAKFYSLHRIKSKDGYNYFIDNVLKYQTGESGKIMKLA